MDGEWTTRGVMAVVGALALVACGSGENDGAGDASVWPVTTPDAALPSRVDAALPSGASSGTPFDGGVFSGDGAVITPPAADAAPPAPDAAANDCDPAQTLPPGDHEFTLTSKNGLTYKYLVVVPQGVVPGKKTPLVTVWHALTSSPEETRKLTDVDASSARDGVITVHPRSHDQAWDVGSCCTTAVLGRARDETVFVKELLAELRKKLCIDDQHIYTSGFSNGGMMSQMLACKMADTFAASVPMGSNLTIPQAQCKPARPIPIFMINGTADPLVGYASSSWSGGLSATDSFALWAKLNQCTGQPEVTLQKGKATCKTYKRCAAGVEVTLCSVEGMRHCVPGMKAETPSNCLTKLVIPLGMPNDDIDGITLGSDFMRRWTLP